MRAEGVTRDISATGAYVACSIPLPQDAKIRFEITLASLEQRLSMTGGITHADANGSAVRFDEVLAAFGKQPEA